MRIAFCIDNLAPSGGTELNAVRTAERLDQSAYRPTLVSMQADGAMKARYAAAGVPVVHFSPGGSLVGRRAMEGGRRLADFLRSEAIDVVHCHDVYSNFFCGLAARAAGIPFVTSKRWTFTTPAHTVLNGLAYRLSDAILANSDAVADSLRRSAWVVSERVHVVPNFVDDDAFDEVGPAQRAALRRRFGVPPEAEVVGIVARLRPEKNHQLLLHAVARLAASRPALHAVIVGDGDEGRNLEALASSLGIRDRIRLVGHVPSTDGPHHAFDVSVLCSLHEGFPNSLVEAMAAGRPVVATDVGGVRDAVTDGVTGLLVPLGSTDRFVAALDRLLSDRGLAEQLGGRGRSEAWTRFRAASALGRLTRIYDELATARPRPASR